ncbi:HipA domain-containing protein [Candidatus Margulisiibacteriota bacterium]
MNRCPITYELCGDLKYSVKGLKLINRQLTDFQEFPYTAEEQRQEAALHSDKMSIQGVQPKLSVVLNVRKQNFEIVDSRGLYILKPQHIIYSQLPENEDVTMRMAKVAGLNIPFHGLIYSKDRSMVYFIKRFDRKGRNGKLAVEDFAQLAGKTRDTKYSYSMEKLVHIIDDYCTFPAIEKVKLLRLTLFSFLTGNEDMHLKNFSIIRRDETIELSPAYDLLNTTIAMKNATEEMALPIKGKKRNLNRKVLINYFAKEQLDINDKVISVMLKDFENAYSTWTSLIDSSFLSLENKDKYLTLINKRHKILFTL